MYRYSKTTGGFYIPGFHQNIPGDAVDVSEEEHAELMRKQEQGLEIAADASGRPVGRQHQPTQQEQIVAETAWADGQLNETMWTQLADAELTEEEKTAYTQYRQALRAYVKHPSFPNQPRPELVLP